MQSWLTHAESWPAVNARGGAINGTPFQEGPTRVAVDTSNAVSVRIAALSYGESGRVPHFTLDATTETVAQHLDIQLAPVSVTDFPVEPHRFGHNIWVTVLTPAGETPTAKESMWLGGEVAKIAAAAGSLTELYSGDPMGVGEWLRFEGVAFTSEVPLTHASDTRVDKDMFLLGLYGSPVASGFEISDEDISPTVAQTLEEIENGDVTTVTSIEEFRAALDDVDTIETETIMVTPVVNEPTAVATNEETVLGKFPGRKVQVGSGGKAVATMKEAFGLGKGKFDEELEDHVKMIQELADLHVDGVVDSDTWAAIDTHLLEE